MHKRFGSRFGMAVLLAGGLALRCAQAAPAEQRKENNFEITPFGGFMAGGEFEDPLPAVGANGDLDVKEKANYGLFFDINASGPERQYELFYSRQATEVESAVPLDLDIEYLQIGGIVNFTDNEHVIPFFGITLGGARFTPDAPGLDTETKLAFSVGGGVKIPVTDHIGIRLDTRAFITLLDSDANFFCVSSGGAGTCRIRAKSDTFLQYSASLGVVIGF